MVSVSHAEHVKLLILKLDNVSDQIAQVDKLLKSVEDVKLVQNIASLIRQDKTLAVTEYAHQENAMVTNISQDLVNMLHVEECKELLKTAEVVNQLSVDQMKLKMILVLDVYHVVLVNFLIEPRENVTDQNVWLDQLFK
jgi:radical SAM superfamily enzyme